MYNETIVTLQGRIGTDVVLRQAGGAAVANFRLACTPRRFHRQTGEWSDGPTQWYTVNAWRALGEHCQASLRRGDPVVAAIRPEDVIPHGSPDEVPSTGNRVEATIDEMEFLGSFWRARLTDESLGDAELIADFSINAVRRLDLAEGRRSVVELPATRLLVFPRRSEPGA